MKTVIVTGGAGFIGSAMVRFLIKNTDFKVVNVDKLTYAANLDSLREVSNNNRYIFEKVDICDRSALEKVFYKYKPGYLINMAAETHVDRSIDDPWNFIETNIIGTYTLLEVIREYYKYSEQKDNFRFLHVSTDEVYGELPHPDEDPLANSIKFIENHHGNKKEVSIYGQEYTNTTYKLAKMNLAIRGISGNFGEKAADTFTDDQHKDLKADFIMANPPFNQK
ncbi:MAG: GDP-mannose 4,6-dehydratase, partial [Candidatus Sericytochromatia bacterium]